MNIAAILIRALVGIGRDEVGKKIANDSRDFDNLKTSFNSPYRSIDMLLDALMNLLFGHLFGRTEYREFLGNIGWPCRVRDFNASDPTAVHQLKAGNGVMLLNDFGNLFKTRDIPVIPDTHHSDITFSLTFGFGKSPLGGDNARSPPGLSLHITHFLIGDISVSIIEICLCGGIFYSVLNLQFANLDWTENMRIFLNSW